MTTETAGPAGLDSRLRTLGVFGIIAVLLGVAAVLGPQYLHRPPYLPGLSLPWWVMALGFAATETFVLHMQARRETQTVSLSELPLMLGLFFAGPLDLLAGQMIASTLIMVIHRRSPLLKIVFNQSLFVFETSLVLTLFHALAPAGGVLTPVTWLAAYVAVLVAGNCSVAAICSVIAMRDGGADFRALLSPLGSLLVPSIGVTLGLLAATCLAAAPATAWLLVGLVALLLLGFRAYASLAERHLNLERLYRFSQAVSNAPEVDVVMGNVLTQAKDLLRCEKAAASFVDADGGLIAQLRLGPNGQLARSEQTPGPEDVWAIRQVLDDGRPLLVPRNTRDPLARGWLDAYGLRDAVVVPLTGGAGIVGALIVGDRLGDVRTFEQDDVLLLETVANHASVALRNGELIGRLRHDALHDALTGLPNRTHLQRTLATALEGVSAGRVPGTAVMILDLDEFKEVNDTLGHHQGDALLVEVGARLTRAVGDAGMVARLGGDEFAVLLPDTDDEDHALRIGRRMIRALEQPIALDGLEVEIGASVGVALAPEHAADASALLKRADLAMYDAKTSPRSLRLYEPDLDSASPRRLTLVSELRSALQHGGIEVHVQPQARLGSGEVVGVEALVRWEHPELGSVAPDEFIPIAERSGLIGLLTTRVLDASLAACARWRAEGLDLGVAVNLSTRSLHDADLVEEVARLLRRHGVPASRLTLEVTEGSVMADPARAVALLHQLRDLGVRLSVDDFGTGYSSLSYLQRLPVQEVKIDRSFITALHEDGDNGAIVRAIVDLGRHLGLDVVAEGVEDEGTWEQLSGMHCDLVQGYHLARPMPIDELAPWLAARGAPAARGGLRVV